MKMSFYDGTLDTPTAKEIIQNTDKQILWTHGFRFRNPTTLDKPITKEKALDLLAKEWCDLSVKEDGTVYIQTYSENDMW